VNGLFAAFLTGRIDAAYHTGRDHRRLGQFHLCNWLLLSGIAAERFIGSIRHECTDHIIVLGETHLLRVLMSHITMQLGHIDH
jgi:hypothetical protein